MSNKPKALVLVGFGINCEVELAHALSLAGLAPEFVHFNQLGQNSAILEEHQLLAIPGGFSFGDDIQAGRVLANKFKFKLRAPLEKFIDSGKPVLGVCNGFQFLVQLGALPGWPKWERSLTLMRNASGRFENRWVRLRTEASACPYAQNLEFLTMPSRHGEGCVALSHATVLDQLNEQRQIVFRYAASHDNMKATSYPDNPNGSVDAIAGLCNPAGNVLGLMPHPECHVRYIQSPHWTAHPPQEEEKGIFSSLSRSLGLAPAAPSDAGNCRPFFDNLAAYAKKYI